MIVGFSKLFSDIIHSTVWREEMHVKVVWITMLAMADRHGQVMASVPGLADAAKVTLEQCLDALEKFQLPDEYSRTKDYDGRRIMEIDGGWLLFNYEKFRDRKDDEEQRIKTRDRVRKFREKAKDVTEDVTVTHGNDIQRQMQITDTEIREEPPQAASRKRGSRIPEPFLLTAEMRRYSSEKRPEIDVVLETEKFCNYWRAKTGRDATKLDWPATWRNWILNARANNGITNQNNRPTSEREKSAERGANAVALIDELRRQGRAVSGGDSEHHSQDAIVIESSEPH